ncbi:hypothetical protein MTO96_026876 [Rhipicephalus appendiculatus]
MIIFVLLFEAVGQKNSARSTSSGARAFGTTVSTPLLKAIGTLQPRWALAHAVFTLPVALLSLLCSSLEESPNWLISTSRMHQAERTMLTIGKENGVDVEKARVSLRLLRDQIRQQGTGCPNSLAGLLKSDTGSEAPEKPTDIYQAAAFAALQSCIYFAACQLMGKKGERQTLTTMLVILCLSAATYIVAQLLDFWSAFPHLGSLVLAMCPPCLSVAYAYTADVCPISIRSTGLCLAYSCGRVGGVLGVIAAKKEAHPLALSVTTTLMVAVSAGAIQWLPEVFIKRSPKTPLEPDAMSPEQRKEALKESIAAPTREKKSHRHRSPRRSKARPNAGSPEPVDVGSDTAKQVASPSL